MTDTGTFQVVEITPPALQNIGWRTYVIFAVLNLVNTSIVWAFYPETAGLTLESIDTLFREHGLEKEKKLDADGEESDRPMSSPGDVTRQWTSALQWSIILRADAAVRQLKKEKSSLAKAEVERGSQTAERRSVTASVEEEKEVEHQLVAVEP